MNEEIKKAEGLGKPRPVALTKEEFGNLVTGRVENVTDELRKGFEFLRGMERTVSFFGSARLTEDNDHYKTAQELAKKIGECGIGVITGGGPGIMEAANRGATVARGFSLGLNIKLEMEQKENPYLTDSMTFKYFFVRKVCLVYAAEAYIFFPGGFGTLDEFFEIITLVQTGKIEKVPLILVGKSYWKKLDSFIKRELYKKHGMIDKKDISLYIITDDIDKIVDIVRHAPIRSQV